MMLAEEAKQWHWALGHLLPLHILIWLPTTLSRLVLFLLGEGCLKQSQCIFTLLILNRWKNSLLHELVVYRCLTGLQGLIALFCAFFGAVTLCDMDDRLFPVFPTCSWKILSWRLLVRKIMVFQEKILKIICDTCWRILCLVWWSKFRHILL